jgi:hypothetical protein
VSTLPDVGAVLAPLLALLPRAEQPLLIALAERMAAERYRGWAASSPDASARAALLACAAREEEIAAKVEALFPGAAAVQQALRERHPELPELNRSLFAGRPLAEQLAIQASGERLGAATWRSFARREADAARRAALLACAELEEASARAVEALLERGAGG